MTSRQQLRNHGRRIGEIRDIMNSMKTLTWMETRKLDRLLENQHAVVTGIEAVAADFVDAFPQVLPQTSPAREVCLLIGSERGFCGDFNDVLVHALEHELQTGAERDGPDVFAIGGKLGAALGGDARIAEYLDGAGVVEEVETVLSRVVDRLDELQAQHVMLTVTVWHHAADGDGVLRRPLFPPFQEDSPQAEHFPCPPVLNLEPQEFLVALSDHYLYAVLHEIFYTSLLAENRRRIQHLEGAVKHLDDESARLRRQFNARRQEEIIEEIEVILLSAASLAKPQVDKR
jgi:F-type H+-transporting ATPase subunit gamma